MASAFLRSVVLGSMLGTAAGFLVPVCPQTAKLSDPCDACYASTLHGPPPGPWGYAATSCQDPGQCKDCCFDVIVFADSAMGFWATGIYNEQTGETAYDPTPNNQGLYTAAMQVKATCSEISDSHVCLEISAHWALPTVMGADFKCVRIDCFVCR